MRSVPAIETTSPREPAQCAGPVTAPLSVDDRLGGSLLRRLGGLVLVGSFVLYSLHFLHLGADFPHGSPWNDWSRYTDEGWYGDGAIRHFVLGHWYLPGDFNPAVAMPVWPLLEAAVFSVTGVSLIAARALTVAVFGVALLALHGLLRQRGSLPESGQPYGRSGFGLGPALAVLFACANPFLFAFDRLAILEPLVAALGLSALWLASSPAPLSAAGGASLHGWARLRLWGEPVGLGVLLALLALSKPTALALFPGIFFLLWRTAGGSRLAAARRVAGPALIAGALLCLYLTILVRFHLVADFRYLFDANAYTGYGLQPLSEVVRNTLWDTTFAGTGLCGLCVGALAAMVLWRRSFFRDPRVGALLLWVAGSLLLLGYHNNLQPRYYLPVAFALIALLALVLEEVLAWAFTLRASARRSVMAGIVGCCVAVCVGAVTVPGIVQEVGYLRHPEYTYLTAAREIAAMVREDPRQSPWVLSVSGSDLTLMTGLPSIDDDFGTMDLDERVRAYRPGWYVAWNELDDDKMDALRPLYQPVRVAAFPAMDDPDRNLLILYRLDAPQQGSPRHRRGHPLPPALRTRRGQQPAAPQLRH